MYVAIATSERDTLQVIDFSCRGGMVHGAIDLAGNKSAMLYAEHNSLLWDRPID